MPFWTNGADQDPKRQYRFVASFSGLGDCSWFVKNVDKPSLSLSEASHEYLNHTFYYPGRASWNTISVTLVDPVEPDAAATMMQAIRDSGYEPPKDSQDLNTVSKSQSINALGTVTIQQLKADGDQMAPVEEWRLVNAWIKSVTLSGLDYSGDALSDVTLEIRYDWAEMMAHGSTQNVGVAGSSTPLTPNKGIFKISG